MLMDLEIANDVMKAMYLQCKATGKGYTDAEFKAMVEKISGISFTNFWAKYVNGTDPIEYSKYLGYAGINVEDLNAGKNIPYLGIATRKTEGHIMISAVSRNSGAWTDGLNVGDEVLSIDGVPAEPVVEKTSSFLDKKVGDAITVKVKRDDRDMDVRVVLKATPNVRLSPSMASGVTPAQKLVLRKWMGI
jgi:predicted metalloprotease with PDZ domain